jgi:RNA polymerase sigma-70 factor (ECF subfamily)
MNKPRDTALARLFLDSYDALKLRLKRRLGSDDLACDVLHETYLRVDRMDSAPQVQKPDATCTAWR